MSDAKKVGIMWQGQIYLIDSGEKFDPNKIDTYQNINSDMAVSPDSSSDKGDSNDSIDPEVMQKALAEYKAEEDNKFNVNTKDWYKHELDAMEVEYLDDAKVADLKKLFEHSAYELYVKENQGE